MDYPDFYHKGPALCTKTDPDLFFPEAEDDNSTKITREAKKVCGDCPYTEECLAWATWNNEIGIWGGTTRNERRRFHRKSVVGITNGRVQTLVS